MPSKDPAATFGGNGSSDVPCSDDGPRVSAARALPDDDATVPTTAAGSTPAWRPITTRSGEDGAPDGGAHTVRVGDVVGRHVLIAELGQGGMGHVFAARDAGLDRTVAIKFVSVASRAMVERFLAEARVTARCTHPNIVTVYEIGQHRDAPYLVLEHLAGPSLAQLASGPPLSVARVVAIMTAVARALACAHSHGIVHRDLKPSNIAVLADDTVKVLDFGIAAFAQATTVAPDATPAPTDGAREIAGTLPYMAPEQVLGEQPDGRADVWSFGVVLFQLLAGARPFDHLTEAALRAELLDLDRPTPSITAHRPDLPPGLVHVVARCLEKPRARRYRSANELVAALQRLAGDQAACELPLWLASAPSADEGDRVALGLARALAERTDSRVIDADATRVWPDGRVELAEGAAVETPADAVRAVARLASQAIDSVGGIRTRTEQRRARRMRRALGVALHPNPARRPSAHQLERRLSGAHARRGSRRAMAAAALVGLVAVGAAAWLRPPSPSYRLALAAGVTPSVTRQLERLEHEVARTRGVQGDGAADALFDGFVSQPENAGLRVAAWLRRSAREVAARDFEPALASAAAAYLAAPTEDEAAHALEAVLAIQVTRRSWDEVARALGQLGATAALTDAAATLAVATRRVPTGDHPARTVLTTATPLFSGQPSPLTAELAEAIDLDGDGLLAVVTVDGRTLRGARPGAPPLWERALPATVRGVCAARDTRGSWFAVVDATATRLFQVDASGATEVLTVRRGNRCALGDLDGDGAVELYVGGDRDLVRHRAEPAGPWRASPVELGSVVGAMVAADLDGDGRSELVIAAGEWQAYDVRVLAGAEMTLVDRLRLGRVAALTTLSQGAGRPRVLLARKDRNWPSVRYLPPEHPAGAPEGYYALRLQAGRLRVTSYLADDLATLDGRLHALDLDGDGRDEALATEVGGYGGGNRTVVMRLDEADQLDGVTIEGIAIRAVGRFAADRPPAALAWVGTGAARAMWWLGLGATPVPPLALAPPAVDPGVPSALDDGQATTWRRAGVLGQVGATATAIAAFERLAAVVPPELQPRALGEVLTLLHRRGEPLGEIHAALIARTAPGSPAQLAALMAAATAAVDDGELATAVQAIDAALASPALEAVDRAQLRASRASIDPLEVSLFEGAPLDDAWQVLDPVGVWRDPVTRALVLDGFGSQPLAAVELTRARGPIELKVDGTITRAEWAAGLEFALRPAAGEPLVTFTLGSTGGGGIYRLSAELDAFGTVLALGPLDRVDAPVALRVRATWFPDSGRLIWDFTAGDVHVRRALRRRASAATRWQLAITSHNRAGLDNPTRMAMAIDRIEVGGLVRASAPTRPPAAVARLALANGDYDRARALLARRSGPDAALATAVRALRVGDRTAAVAALARLPGGAARGPTMLTLAHLARVDDDAYAEPVRAAAGHDRVAVISAAWTAVARQHPDAEQVQRELTQNLRDLDLRKPDHGSASPAATTLLLLRARARARIGEFADADGDLDALLAPARLPSVPAATRAEAYLARAQIAVHRGDVDLARHAVRDALDASPWPETIADLVLLDPGLAAVARGPGLERVHLLGRPLGGP
ncbi:MAG: protein kinase [Kofleriaceae bacterium]